MLLQLGLSLYFEGLLELKMNKFTGKIDEGFISEINSYDIELVAMVMILLLGVEIFMTYNGLCYFGPF